MMGVVSDDAKTVVRLVLNPPAKKKRLMWKQTAERTDAQYIRSEIKKLLISEGWEQGRIRLAFREITAALAA
jgi:hypothetical protein